MKISLDLEVNQKTLEHTFHNCMDIIIKPIELYGGTKLLLVFNTGLTDTNELEQIIIKPLFQFEPHIKTLGLNTLKLFFQPLAQTNTSTEVEEVVKNVLYGSAAIFIHGVDTAFTFQFIRFPRRAVEEPATETSIRGPRDLNSTLGAFIRKVSRMTIRNIGPTNWLNRAIDVIPPL